MINNFPFYPQYYPKSPPNYPQNIYTNAPNNYAIQNNRSSFHKRHKLNNEDCSSRKFCKNEQFNNKKISSSSTYKLASPQNSSKHTYSKEENVVMFELFGIKLCQDDILLICLIFFLYNEGIKDEFLFVALILLLLS